MRDVMDFGTLEHPNGDSERIYRPDEVAEILDCDQGHVYDLIRAGRLQAVNIGRGSRPVWRIRHSAVEAILAADPQPGSPPPKIPKAKPVDTFRDRARGLSGSFAAAYRARQKGG